VALPIFSVVVVVIIAVVVHILIVFIIVTMIVFQSRFANHPYASGTASSGHINHTS
jgi:hypothetical protein